jgi:membrane fusion protein (multidrug efflux system)
LRQYGLSSEADLEHAEFEAKGSEFDLASWKANLEKSQAEIRRLEAELDKTRIRAPFAGMVAHRYIRMGQGVSKTDKCFRISQLSPLLVQFQVPESAGRRPQRGATVNLSLVGDSNRALTARIVNVGPTVDPASDSYNVTAQLTGAGLSDLRPGMSVRVDWPRAANRKP